MPYNSIISRADVAGLIPAAIAKGITEALPEKSAALTLFQRVPATSRENRFLVKSALPIAYFVNGDTGLKQTTELNWDDVYAYVEEIACIVPIPDAVADDIKSAGRDVWAEIKPDIETAIGRTLDAAIFFAVNKPASWPAGIVAAATAAGNTVVRGTNAAAAGGIAGDISDLMSLIEADGYDVNGFAAATTYKGILRKTRDTVGARLPEVSASQIEGIDIAYPMRGLWPTGAGSARLIGGDFSRAVIGVRQDITYKMLDQAVIQDGAGVIQYNLAQQDMQALRVVFRCFWQMANPINYDQPTEADRYPFAVLLEA